MRLALEPHKYEIEVANAIVSETVDVINFINDKGYLVPSPLLVVPLFTFISNMNQLQRICPGGFDSAISNSLAKIFNHCGQEVSSLENGKFETITQWFWWIVRTEVGL